MFVRVDFDEEREVGRAAAADEEDEEERREGRCPNGLLRSVAFARVEVDDSDSDSEVAIDSSS